MRLIDADEIRTKAVPHTRGGNGGWCADIRKWAVLVSDIDNAPTVDAEPVIHAVWEKDGTRCECSNCSAFANLGQARVWKYCPMCGAHMDEKE